MDHILLNFVANGRVIATSPIIPSFEERFVFFKFIDFSYCFPYVFLYIFLISFFLQFYLLCCFFKSIFIKEYIFSYITFLKTQLQFSFWEFLMILFTGFVFTFICIGVDVYDKNIETAQLVAAASNHAVSELSLDVGELKYHYFVSVGLKTKSPCELAGTCINDE